MITAILCIVCALALPDGIVSDQNGETPEQPTSLSYDYTKLRNWGLILAAVFFFAGLLVLFGKHCKCNFAKDKGQPEEEVMQRRMSMRQAAVSAEV